MMLDMPHVTSNEKALYYVREGKYAFMTDVTQLYYIVSKDCHVYSLADETFNNAGLGFVVSERALYKDALNFKRVIFLKSRTFLEIKRDILKNDKQYITF